MGFFPHIYIQIGRNFVRGWDPKARKEIDSRLDSNILGGLPAQALIAEELVMNYTMCADLVRRIAKAVTSSRLFKPVVILHVMDRKEDYLTESEQILWFLMLTPISCRAFLWMGSPLTDTQVSKAQFPHDIGRAISSKDCGVFKRMKKDQPRY